MADFLNSEWRELRGGPIENDNVSYWGPMNREISDSLLAMAEIFLQKYFKIVPKQLTKSLFLLFIEMVQNVADYYSEKDIESLNHCYIYFNIEEQGSTIFTGNQILEEDLSKVREVFEELNVLSESQLGEKHKNAIFSKSSLGLLIVKKMKDSQLDWEIVKDSNQNHWLNIKLKVNYGKS